MDLKTRIESCPLSKDILEKKYLQPGETYEQWLDRISNGDKELKNLINEGKFLFGGRILSSRGLNKLGRKVTLSNCYVLERPSDNLESIIDTAKKMARTFSFGGGVGIDLSNLRPKGSPVHNAAKTTSGATSFMHIYDTIGKVIGQNGRRAATMISLSASHPDVEDFIEIKTKDGNIEMANISVRVDDRFMEHVKSGKLMEVSFECEDGTKVTKTINPKYLFNKLAKANHEWAEPGILYWDRIANWNLVSEFPNFEYAGVNPCARVLGSR